MIPLPFPEAHAAARTLSLLLAASLASTLANAQTAGGLPRVDPVFVTATRSPEPLAAALADVTVIGAAEIARSGAQGLAELLQRQPGIEITQNGGPGSTSGAFLRGTNRGQTLVLVDGVRLASATVGATSLEAIPLDQIERIEILRGPASSLYGADAIGGVIQIFTRKGERTFTGGASASYGTYDTRALSGSVSGPAGPLTFSLGAGTTRSSGFNAIVDPSSFFYNPDRDGYERNSGSASLALEWAPGQTLSAQYLRSRLNAQVDLGPGYDDRTITTLDALQVSSANRLAARWTSTLTFGRSVDDSDTISAFGEAPFRTVQHQYGWQNLFTLDAGTLTLGLERLEENVSGADYAVDSRDTNSVYAIYQLRSDGHALQMNLRHDNSTQYGARTTGGVAYGYRFSPAWRVTVGASNAFKAPSFNDLYFPDFSNPDLAPETSRNVEAGVYWTAAGDGISTELRAIAWYNRVDDLIVFGCTIDFVCRPENVGSATLQGVTIGAGLGWKDTTLRASIDLQSPEDDETGHLLPRRSRQHGTIAVQQLWHGATLGFEFLASGRRYDDPANRVPLGGYAILNVTVEWPFARQFALFVRGDNVFDRNYQLASGFSTGGAQWLAGIRWRP